MNYTITEEQRDAIINYFQKGNGSKLPYGEVAQIISILASLKEVKSKKK